MSTSSYQHLRKATSSKPGQYRYCPSPNFSLIFCINFGCWHLSLISTSSSRCKSFSVMPRNLVSDACVMFFYQMIYKINKCSCAVAALLYIWNCLIVIDRLWSGSEQAADEWGVGLVSGAPSPPRDAMSSCSRSVHQTEISQHFFWIMICSHWIVEPWKTQHLVFT